MKVLIIGASGQLGTELIMQSPIYLNGSKVEIIVSNRDNLDLSDPQACPEFIYACNPDWVINSGAYTAVDEAESQVDIAYAVNAEAPAKIAEALLKTGGRILQISTDFVFDGTQSQPYNPEQALCPLNVYGASKAAGEVAVLKTNQANVLRTSWLYGPFGKNFVLTMLKLHALKASLGEPLQVVADQVGCPTSVTGLAKACWCLLEKTSSGTSVPATMHWSDAGVASWYDFAVAIGELGKDLGLINQSTEVQPITSAQYPTPARRPSYSVLDCSATHEVLEINPVHWRNALKSVLRTLLDS